MDITVLGCSGGIGGGRHTTSFLVDDDVLIDAGTGVTTLTLEQMAKIDHVFLTHAHLDHILALPLLLDAVGDARPQPLVIHALPEVVVVLEAHIFNWQIWPDFRRVPNPAAPWMAFESIHMGETHTVKNRRFTALPANHVVPSCALSATCDGGSFVFSGDTTSCPELVAALNGMPELKHLVIETSFGNDRSAIGQASKHHWPDSLAAELAALKVDPLVWITHLKPGNEDGIMAELTGRLGLNVAALAQGQVLTV